MMNNSDLMQKGQGRQTGQSDSGGTNNNF